MNEAIRKIKWILECSPYQQVTIDRGELEDILKLLKPKRSRRKI